MEEPKAEGTAESKIANPESESKSSLDREVSALTVANEFLNREISRLEKERDGLLRELKYVTAGYSWRVIRGYRQWLAHHQNSAFARFSESLTIWILSRIYGRLETDPEELYQRWMTEHELTPARIDSIAAAILAFPYRPLFNVCIMARDGIVDDSLSTAITSIQAQIYENWQACVIGNATENERLPAASEQHAQHDSRIRDTIPREAEFLVFMDQRGELSRDALFELALQINRNRGADLIYWDEDKLDRRQLRHSPFFKPDWSPDLILSMNYIGRSFALRRSLLDKVGGVRLDSYDVVLRASEHSQEIIHIPKILYHQHKAGESWEEREALEGALRRRGIRSKLVDSANGHHFVRYEIRGHPRVSILIPTRDKRDLLEKCVDSIVKKTDYDNYEIIILDNDSNDADTLRYFDQIADKASVLHCPGAFNYSAINNRGTDAARGEFILFLNNDTEVISPEWMRALIEQAQRPEVGAVGAKLLFRDGRIQHAGVVLGIDGLALHIFGQMPDDTSDSPELANVIR